MNTPAFADTTLGTLTTAKQEAAAQDAGQVAAAARPDCLFVIGNLGIGGSERKIVRLANRLKQDGVHVALACMNGPFTIESSIRRDVPCLKLERKGKFSWATVFRLRDILVRQQPATVLALNLYQALYVALASVFLPYRPRKVALVNTSFFRGHRMLMRFYHWVLLQFDVIVHGSEAQRRFWFKPGSSAWNKSVVVYNGVDSDCFEITASFEAGKRLRQLNLERVHGCDVVNHHADGAAVSRDASLPLDLGEHAGRGLERAGALLEAFGERVGAPTDRRRQRGAGRMRNSRCHSRFL